MSAGWELSAAYSELNARLRRRRAFPPAFAQAFPGIPAHIQRLFTAGDMTGRLAEALADAGAELEHEAKVRTELRQALLYPAFLVGFGFLTVVFIFIVVVGQPRRYSNVSLANQPPQLRPRLAPGMRTWSCRGAHFVLP